MVEKKVFDKILSEFIIQSPSIRYCMIGDREGFPISYVGRNNADRQNSKTLSAAFRSLFSPAFHFAGIYGTSSPICSVIMLKDIIILQLNLGLGIANFIIDKFKWPVEGSVFQSLLTELFHYIPQLQANKKSLLKDLFPDGIQMGATRYRIDQSIIPTLIDCINQMGKGSFGNMDWVLNGADAPSNYAQIGNIVSKQALNTVVIGGDGSQLFVNNPEKAKSAQIIFTSNESSNLDLQVLKYGNPLLTIFCFEKGEMVLDAPIGKLNEKSVHLCLEVPQWQQGINTAISALYNAAVACNPTMPSELANQFIELMNFLMSDVNSLKEIIDQYLGVGRNEEARELMERSTFLLQNMNEMSVAADYLKWIAYTYFQEHNHPKALENYERALRMYELANDGENQANSHLDIASVYETMKQRSYALEEFQKALTIFTQIGAGDHAQELNQKISEIKTEYKTQLKDYISGASAESLMFDFLSEKFNIKTSILVNILQELVDSQTIPGQVDQIKGRYTKTIMRNQAFSRTSTAQPTIVPMPGATVNSSSTINFVPGTASGTPTIQVKTIDYTNAYDEATKLKNEIVQLNSDLGQYERTFQMKGINFMDLLKYQAKLEKKNFNELRVRIYTELPQFNLPDGTPGICAVCLNTLDGTDSINVCSAGHGYHAKCLSKWIKTQDRCPVCNEKLLPFILRDYREAMGMSTSHSAESNPEIEKLKAQLNSLKQALGSDVNMFDRLTAEREDKDRLIIDLKKKDQLINELRSQLTAARRN